jgi:hypothetical protein
MAEEKKRSARVGVSLGTGGGGLEVIRIGGWPVELPQGLKPSLIVKTFIAALKRCATQNQSGHDLASRILDVRLVAGEGGSHANHLRESNDRTEDYSGDIEPVSVQTVIE